LREARRKPEAHLENGRNFGNASKIGYHKPAIRNSKCQLQKSGCTETKIFEAKCPGSSVYKVDMTTEKLSSKTGINCSGIRERFEGNEDIHIFLKKISLDFFSGGREK
jgi:hypothetical protein